MKRRRTEKSGVAVSHFTSLPSTIDPTVATSAFRRQRDLLLNLIRHCLPEVANSLFSEYMIPKRVYEIACNENKDRGEKGVALLDCIEDRLEAVPSDFAKVVHILEAEPFLESLAEELIQCYCTIYYAPTVNTPPVTSSAISRYRTYLKTVYKNSPVSPDTKWPSTPSREYISLAVVEGGRKCRDEYIGHTLHGNITDVVGRRREIAMDQILKTKGRNKLRLVLVEGAPGIGKSTLAWELCRKWEEFPCMQQYSLVVLLRLREEEVQNITSVSQLFFSNENETLAKEVSQNIGKGILFILDGFDELPKPLQQKGFILNLIQGRVLPESTVLVTSRPSATGELLTSCRPQIQKHIEVLGFTQESVEAYASSIFSSEPEKLEKFKDYISASKNPAINSLMYVPLNAAIIVEIYCDCKSDDFLPHTLTELYTQLCLTILNRHLKIHFPSVRAEKFEDLPSDLYKHFLHLCEVAFEGVKNEEIIFHTLPSTLVHFGFLDSVPALYGGGGVSYNFLHLTIQEFLAAYHISHLGRSGLQVFQQYAKDQQWDVVWRFVAGLTKFRDYEGHIDRSVFIIEENDELQFSLFLLQCLFEAKSVKHFSSTLKTLSTTARVALPDPTSLDTYVLGYCIANFPIGVSWDVDIQRIYSRHTSFTCGLNTNIPSVGVISSLLIGIGIYSPLDFSGNALHGTTSLRLIDCKLTNADMVHLSELIPDLICLKKLGIYDNHIADGHQDGLLKVLYQLYHSNVTSLDIRHTGLDELFDSPHDYLSALKCLIHPSSGKLKRLAVGESGRKNDTSFVDLLSVRSSLTSLYLDISNLSPHALHLKNNTCLTKLRIFSTLVPQIPILIDIVNHNNTLKELVLLWFDINVIEDSFDGDGSDKEDSSDNNGSDEEDGSDKDGSDKEDGSDNNGSDEEDGSDEDGSDEDNEDSSDKKDGSDEDRFDEGSGSIDDLRPLVHALRENDTLRRIELFLSGIGESDEDISHYMTSHHKELTLDSRIAWHFW